MFKLDDNLLIELGLGSLPPAEKNRMLGHIYETLEMRVGMKLAQRMTNEQLDEFEAFIDRNDEAGALKWLETNFPNYKQVVAEELETLKAEIKAAAPQIVAASQQQAATAGPMAPPAGNPGVQPQQYAASQPAPYGPAPQQYTAQQPMGTPVAPQQFAQPQYEQPQQQYPAPPMPPSTPAPQYGQQFGQSGAPASFNPPSDPQQQYPPAA